MEVIRTSETIAIETAESAAASARSKSNSRLLQGVLFNWGSLIAAAAVSIFLTPVMIRGLGAYYYGMWILVMSIVDQYGLLDMGIGSALTRFASYFRGAKERLSMDEIFCTSLMFTLLISVAICLATVPAMYFLPRFFAFTGPNRPTFAWLVALLGLTTAIAFPERMMAAYLRGLQRFDLYNIAGTTMLVGRGALLAAAVLLGYKVLTVAFLTLASGIVSLLFNYAMVCRADPELSARLKNVSRARLRELFGFSIYVFVASVGTRLITSIDSIVIARVLTVALVTPFSIGNRLMAYFAGVFGGINGPVLSAMSEMDGGARHDDLRHLFVRTSRFSLLLSCLLGCLLIFDGRSLLTLWLGRSGLDIGLSYQVLVILTACYVATNANLPSWTVVYARAQHRLLAWLLVVEGAANLVLSVYWAHRYGLLGVALGTTVPALVDHILIIPWYALRVIDLPAGTFLREGIARPMAGSLLFAGFCWWTMRQSQSLLQFGLTGIMQCAVFALVAYFIGLHKEDRQEVVARIRTWFPRFAPAYGG